MFAQYNLTDAPTATIQATTNLAVVGLEDAGRGQLEIPDDTDISLFNVDVANGVLVSK